MLRVISNNILFCWHFVFCPVPHGSHWIQCLPFEYGSDLFSFLQPEWKIDSHFCGSSAALVYYYSLLAFTYYSRLFSLNLANGFVLFPNCNFIWHSLFYLFVCFFIRIVLLLLLSHVNFWCCSFPFFFHQVSYFRIHVLSFVSFTALVSVASYVFCPWSRRIQTMLYCNITNSHNSANQMTTTATTTTTTTMLMMMRTILFIRFASILYALMFESNGKICT